VGAVKRRDKLAALCRVAELAADRALLPVAQAQARVAEAKADIAAIRVHRAKVNAECPDPVLAALAARQTNRLRLAQAGAMQRLAERMAILETHKASARPAVGRRHVLQALLDQENRKARQYPRG